MQLLLSGSELLFQSFLSEDFAADFVTKMLCVTK